MPPPRRAGVNMDAARVERRGERPVSAGPLNEGVELCGMESIDFLPVVKAYPVLSRTYGEVSCIAGIQMNQPTPRWIRLYPVPFRTLEDDQRFKKYQPMSVEASGHSGDRRPETRRPNRDSFRLAGDSLSTDHGWRARRRFVEPLMVDSMCGVLRQERLDRTSLAVFVQGGCWTSSSKQPISIKASGTSPALGQLRPACLTDLEPRSARGKSANLSWCPGHLSTVTSAAIPTVTDTFSRSSIGRLP